MAIFNGTAPRKVNGVWVTSKGRRLTDAGQRYWENKLKTGEADGIGHYKPAGVGASSSASTSRRTPPPKSSAKAAGVGGGSSASVRVQESKTTGKVPTVHSNPELAKRAAAIRLLQAQGKINVTEAQDRLAKLNVYGGRKLSKAEVFPTPHGAGGLVAKTLGGLVEDAYNLPAGVRYSAEHPIGAAKATWEGVKMSAEHPLRRPDLTLLNLLGAKGALGGAIGRTEAVVTATRGVVPKTAAEAVRALPKADAKAYRVLLNPRKHLAKIDEATLSKILTPSPALQHVLNTDAHTSAVRAALLKHHEAGDFKPNPTKLRSKPVQAVREAGATKPAQIAKAALRTPVAKRRSLTVHGAEGSHVVHPLGSRDYLTNFVQRNVVDKRTQAKLSRQGVVPASHAIAEALRLTEGQGGMEVGAALHAIDKVHGMTPLDRRVMILNEPRMSEGSLGVLYSLPDRHGQIQPYGMQLKHADPSTQMPLTHEFGHAVEKAVANPARGREASIAYGHVLAAIAKSDAFKAINAQGGALARYAGSLPEGFARAYAQYIGHRSGHEPILKGISEFDKHFTDRGGVPWHWTEQDFKPIADAFDQMFEKLGWQKDGKPLRSAIKTRPQERLSRVVGPEIKVGRELRAERRVQDALEMAKVARLERFGKTKSARIAGALTGKRLDVAKVLPVAKGDRLSASEQKAVDIASSGATAAEHIAYHEAQIARLEHVLSGTQPFPEDIPGIVGKFNTATKVRAEIRRQRMQIAAARLAEKHLANPSDKLNLAIRESRNVIRAREKLLKINPDVAAHRIGARQAEIAAGAKGEMGMVGGKPVVVTPLVKLDATERALADVRDRIAAIEKEANGAPEPDNPLHESYVKLQEAEARLQDQADAIHSDFIARGKKAQADGAFYLPSKNLRELRQTPAGAGRQGSEYGYAPPRVLPELTHPYKAALQRTGNFRFDATGLASESYRRAQRYASVERGYRQLLKLSHSTKSAAGPFAIPVRMGVKVPQGLREAILKADQGTLTREDIAKLGPQEAEAYVKELFPDPRELTDEQLKGVRWVDGRVAAGFRSDFNYGGAIGKGVESFNAPFRASLLYTKPAYAINLLQNIGTNVIRQGVFTPTNMVRALRMGRELGADDQWAIFNLVGEGLSRSFEAEAGMGAKAINAAGEWWNVAVDRYPRAAAWLHEARTMGYNTPEKIHQLLRDQRMHDDLVEVTRRSNKEAVEYGQLTPVERNVLKRAIFFYGWVRGSTLYTLRFPKEHPIQAAIAGNLGAYGKAQNDKVLGPGPHYKEGSFPAFGGLVDPQNINTFETPAGVGEAVAGFFQPSKYPSAGDFVQNLSPAAAAVYTLLSGKTTLGHELPGDQSRFTGALDQLGASLPEASFLRRLHPSSHANDPNPLRRPIYKSGPYNAWGKYLAGGMFPAKFDKQAYNARGEAEQKTMMRPGQRVLYSANKWRTAFVDNAKWAGFLDKNDTTLPTDLQDAINARVVRYSFYASLGIKRSDGADYQRKAFEADVKLLKRRKLMPADEAVSALEWAKTAKTDELRAARDDFTRKEFLGSVLSDYRSQLKKAGRDPGDPFPPP